MQGDLSKTWARLRRLPFGFGLAATLAVLSAVSLQFVLRSLLVAYPASDYRFPETVARFAFAHGWSRIYDVSLPAAGIFVVNPPPYVWLVAPFALLPSSLGYAVFGGLLLACLVSASQILSGSGFPTRLRAAGVVLALLPAAATVIYGQVTAILVLALAACWVLARGRRDVLAGVVLAVGTVKPHLLLLVPFTLLLAGRSRIFAGWAMAAGILALASVASLGIDGTRGYVEYLLHYDHGGRALYSMASLVGPGPPLLLARVLIVLATLAVGYLGRRDTVTIPIAAGVAGSLLVSGYLSFFDLALYAPILLMLMREGHRLPAALAVTVVLWLTLDVAISVGWLVVTLELLLLLALLLPPAWPRMSSVNSPPERGSSSPGRARPSQG